MHTVEEKTIQLWYNTGVIFVLFIFQCWNLPTCRLKADSLQQARF